MNWITSRLTQWFKIEAGERRFVALFLAHSFFLGITLIFAETAAYALFLERYDKGASILPIAYVVSSVVTVTVGLLYSSLEPRLSFVALLSVNLGLVTLALVAFWGAFAATMAPWPALVAVVGFDVIWVLINLEFWGLAGRVFNVRQGKRLFGLIGSGETVATIVGGALLPLVVALVGTPNLLLLGALGVGMSFFLMRAIQRRHATQSVSAAEEQTVVDPTLMTRPDEDRRPREMLRDRYVVLIFALAGLAVATIYFVENAFYFETEQQFANSAQTAAFLGVFTAVAGVAQLFVRAYLTGRVLGRFGVRAGLLILPLSLALGALLTLGASQLIGLTGAVLFAFFVLTRFFDKSFRYSLNRAALLVLYQPLTARERLWAQTVSESVVEPSAGVMAGLSLLALNNVFGLQAVGLLAVMLGVIVVWVIVVGRLNARYTDVLVRALTKRRLNRGSIELLDGSSLSVLQETLKSPRPGEVIYALNTLEAAEHPTFEQVLIALVTHPAPEVRREALLKIETHRVSAAREVLASRLMGDAQEEQDALRGLILRALTAIEADDFVVPYLQDPSEVLQRGAVVALLKAHRGEGYQAARECLQTLVTAPDAEQRILAARIIQEAADRDLRDALGVLLEDEDKRVRDAALAAVRRLPDRALWPRVMRCLASGENTYMAVSAMSSGGMGVLPQLVAAYSQPDAPRALRVQLVRIMGFIGGESVVNWLKNRISTKDEVVRYAILDALRRAGYKVASPEERRNVEHTIDMEVREAAWTLAAISDVDTGSRGSLIFRALTRELELTRQRVLLLLSFIYDARSILSVDQKIVAQSREKQAYAMEILDTVIAQDMKSLVMPLLDVIPNDEKLRALSYHYPQRVLERDERMRLMLSAATTRRVHPWTRATALYTLSLFADVSFADDIIRLLATDDDPIVRETAIWALYSLAPTLYRLYAHQVRQGEVAGDDRATQATLTAIDREISGESNVLLTIEKVIILKTVAIFSETPDDLLAEIATLLEEVPVQEGEPIIHKGDIGTALYVIASGSVRVHDGERYIATLGERDVVGEMALLDAQPRNADVSAAEETLLLKLDQDPFYELMANYPEVVRGIIRVLARRLRETSTQAQSASLGDGSKAISVDGE